MKASGREAAQVATAKPRIYGDERRYKTTLDRQVRRGKELLDELEGVRRVIEGETNWIIADIEQQEWTHRVERWRITVLRAAHRHLADAAPSVIPDTTAIWPPDDGKPRHRRTIANVGPWLVRAIEELESLRSHLGVHRGLSLAPAAERFQELRASGLVEQRVIDDCAAEMSNPTSPKAISDAIDAAKQLVEATLRGALDRLGKPWKNDDDLPRLMRYWRDGTKSQGSPDAAGAQPLDTALAQLANLVRFIGEWRNAYGRGHGAPKYPKGLAPRHARLASDSADTAIRWVVMTLDDLALLPPD